MRKDHRTGKYSDVQSEIIFVPARAETWAFGRGEAGGAGRGRTPAPNAVAGPVQCTGAPSGVWDAEPQWMEASCVRGPEGGAPGSAGGTHTASPGASAPGHLGPAAPEGGRQGRSGGKVQVRGQAGPRRTRPAHLATHMPAAEHTCNMP